MGLGSPFYFHLSIYLYKNIIPHLILIIMKQKTQFNNDESYDLDIENLEMFNDLGNFIAYYGNSAFEDLIQQSSNNRHSQLFQIIAQKCTKYLSFYENSNYNQYSNGESFVLKTIADLFNKEEQICLFDVGANQGYYSLMANEILKNTQIHSFEIISKTVDKLKENTKEYKNIYINDFGLSDKNEKIEVFYYPEADTLSTIYEYPHGLNKLKMMGKTITGDEYIEKNSITNINFLKIDVEGSENLVLDGFIKSFQQRKIDIVQFEYGKINILTHYLLLDFYNFFSEKDYVVGKIYPNYVDFRDYSLDDENFIGPNYLAIKKEKKDYIEALSYHS